MFIALRLCGAVTVSACGGGGDSTPAPPRHLHLHRQHHRRRPWRRRQLYRRQRCHAHKRYATDLTALGYAANPLIVDDQGQSTVAGDTNAACSVSLYGVAATTYTITAAPLNQQLKRNTTCGSLTLDQRGTQAASSGSDDCR